MPDIDNGKGGPRGRLFVALFSAGPRGQAGPLPGLEFAMLDPRPGFGKTGIQGADITHPKAERAAIGIEPPGADNDLVGDVTRQPGAEEQDRTFVLGRRLDRPCRLPQRLDLVCRRHRKSPVRVPVSSPARAWCSRHWVRNSSTMSFIRQLPSRWPISAISSAASVLLDVINIMDSISIMRNSSEPGINDRIAARVRELRNRQDSPGGAGRRERRQPIDDLLVERGESNPTAVVLEKLATGLGVSLRRSSRHRRRRRTVSRRADQVEWRDPHLGISAPQRAGWISVTHPDRRGELPRGRARGL